MAKTWKQKLEGKDQPHLSVMPKAMFGLPAGTRLFIASPALVKAYVEAIPSGRTSNLPDMRAELAARHEADATCPLTAGIFARIVAEAAWDEIEQGTDPAKVTPFWRLIEPGSPLAKKLRCGSDFLREMRAREAAAG